MDVLEQLGFDYWFQRQIEIQKINHHEIARIISVNKDSFMISNGVHDVFSELSGSLLYTTDDVTKLPTVGDWVSADFYDEYSHGIIHQVLPRKTLLKRKAAGKNIAFQLIAANIDVAFIIQSANENFNIRRLERYLVMVNESKIEPIILLSKCDLLPQNEIEVIKQSIQTIAPHTQVLAFSSITLDHIETIKSSLKQGKTYCLLGSSGVGKTTLLNTMLGDVQFDTQTVSKKSSKGRHTTTKRELIKLPNGSLLIDTPGMRELGSLSVDTGLDETFSDIIALTYHCKFSNCSHTNEKGCAVLKAIDNEQLSKSRFKNYIKMQNEAAFNDMSYVEKRKKDKDFGKLIRATMKHKKR